MDNGGPKKLPTLSVGWDAELQQPVLTFESTDFKNWDFVIMVLRGALLRAKDARKFALAQAMQVNVVDKALNQALAQKIFRPR